MDLSFDDLDRETLALLGYIFLESEKTEKALKIFEGMAECFPDDPYAQKALAYAYLRLKRYGDALDAVEKFLAQPGLEPRDRVLGLFMKAHSLWGLEQRESYEKAVSDFLKHRKTMEKKG